MNQRKNKNRKETDKMKPEGNIVGNCTGWKVKPQRLIGYKDEAKAKSIRCLIISKDTKYLKLRVWIITLLYNMSLAFFRFMIQKDLQFKHSSLSSKKRFSAILCSLIKVSYWFPSSLNLISLLQTLTLLSTFLLVTKFTQNLESTARL